MKTLLATLAFVGFALAAEPARVTVLPLDTHSGIPLRESQALQASIADGVSTTGQYRVAKPGDSVRVQKTVEVAFHPKGKGYEVVVKLRDVQSGHVERKAAWSDTVALGEHGSEVGERLGLQLSGVAIGLGQSEIGRIGFLASVAAVILMAPIFQFLHSAKAT